MAQHPPASGASLTGERFDRLLSALADDRAAAADRYASLARRLAAYFRWQRCDDAERLADDVMDRMARRLSEGEAVANLGAYALGVARLVAKEARARAVRADRAGRDFARQTQSTAGHDEAAHRCLDRCLHRLSPDRQRHLLAYYGNDVGGRIDARRRLADALGVSPTALRNRMLRLRQDLEACMTGCLAPGGATHDLNAASGSGGRP